MYPVVRVAVTHRDPLSMLASLTSLVASLRWAHSEDVDYAQIGADRARRFQLTLARLGEWTDVLVAW